MQVQLIELEKIKPYERNNKKHPKEQIEKLARQIKEHGFDVPIVVDKDFVIIKGHGRLEALKMLGRTHADCIVRTDLSPEAAKLARIADNKLAESDYDMANIELELLDLMQFDIDLTLSGFEDLSQFKLLDTADAVPTVEETADAVPDETPKNTRGVVRGQVWQLGNHRLMCGDSTHIASVSKLMNGQKADMVFTDPPYGVSYQSNMRTKTSKFDVLKNDDQFIDGWIPHANSFCTGWVFIWTSWRVMDKWIDLTKQFATMTNVIVWDKGGGGMGDLEGSFVTDFEIALVFNRGSKIVGKRIGSVWSVGKDSSSSYLHPTQKPVELATIALENCVDIGCLVLDFFLGSGSTLIACEKTNRVCYGMELDEHYCSVIIERWEKYTGQKAELIN